MCVLHFVLRVALYILAIRHTCLSFKTTKSIPVRCPRLSFKQVVTNLLEVDLGDRSYPIYIGTGNLKLGEQLRAHVKSKKALIVTNTVVGPLYSSDVRKGLESAGVEVFEVTLPDGEEFKNMEVLMTIIDAAMDAKLDRKSTMIALGGGVVGDMTGFAAAIYQRGVNFVQIPTTLMAMVDSAVGGKTGVNHPKGKNMIGSFNQPEAVIIDINSLDTLPERELCSGMSEIIKYGLIRDAAFFEWLELNIQGLVNRDPELLAYSIYKSCLNKAEVVAADEKEGGIRATLNLGHTFGHAIETGLGYGAWLHGEAVATGTIMAAEMSEKLGWISPHLVSRIRNLLRDAKLPATIEGNQHAAVEFGAAAYRERIEELSAAKFLDLMSMDKKVADGQLNLVLLKGGLGECVITDKFDSDALKKVVDEYCHTKQ